MQEEWKQIRDLDYEVSSLGRVRRRSRPEHLVKLRTYVRVGLVDRGKTVVFLAHRLVAEAFLGPAPEGKADVNHRDGNHANNAVENLEWVDPRENQLHAIKNRLYEGRGEGHGRAKLTEAQVGEIRRRYTGVYGEQTQLAREFGVSQDLIGKIVRGAVWTHREDCPKEPKVVRHDILHAAMLTEEQVRLIRERYTGVYGQQVALAREYNVPVSVVRKALRGESWKHLQGTKFYVIPQGMRHGRAKLTDGKVRWLRQLYARGVPIGELAKRYGISKPVASNIIAGKTWKHIT